jgi:hypothetical protein
MRKSVISLVFASGAVLHLIFWGANVARLSDGAVGCQESQCFRLIALELPVSLLYVSGDHILVTRGSAVLGSLWWGVLAVVVVKLARWARW